MGVQMTAEHIFFMVFMPISNLVSLALLVCCSVGLVPLSPVLIGLGLFFAFWAVRNYIFANQSAERGMFTFGIVVVGGALRQAHALTGTIIAIVGALAIIGSLAYVLSMISTWPASKLAHVQKKSLTWAYIFKLYAAISLITWLGYLALLVDAAVRSN